MRGLASALEISADIMRGYDDKEKIKEELRKRHKDAYAEVWRRRASGESNGYMEQFAYGFRVALTAMETLDTI